MVVNKMKQNNLSSALADADQPVKDFISSIYEALDSQLKQQDDPRIKLEYCGAVMEFRLLHSHEIDEEQKR